MQALPRNYVIEEIHDTEDTYIKLLSVLLDIYAPRLRAIPDIVSPEIYTSMFANLEDIREIHKDFFRRLKVSIVEVISSPCGLLTVFLSYSTDCSRLEIGPHRLDLLY